jgi:hypothetical protein
MFAGRHKLLIITVTIVLIPILLAMTPLGLTNKCRSSISKNLEIRRGARFPFHSIMVYQGETTVVCFESMLRIKAAEIPLDFQRLNSFFIPSNVSSESVPLRC